MSKLVEFSEATKDEPMAMRTAQLTNRVDFRVFEAELIRCSSTCTQSKVFARENPQGIAIYSAFGDRTFRQIHENANHLAHALRQHGCVPGDAIALLCRNRAEFVEVFLAAMRTGLRLTPINTYLTAHEVSYIVTNSEAKVLFVEASILSALKTENTTEALATTMFSERHSLTVIIDGQMPDDTKNINYQNLLESSRGNEIDHPVAGSLMFYTSGTTGKPKGVLRETAQPIAPQYAGSFANYDTTQDTNLCCGPAYHTAPMLLDVRWPLASGVPIVMLEKLDAAKVLDLIESHAITHAHMVPTLFQRLLALDPSLRANRKLSSLRFLVHGAAPCPVHVKRAMIEWFGVLFEYYGATEGGEGIYVDSETWLTKPGTVGRMDASLGHAILDDAMQELPAGMVGRIYFGTPTIDRFSYFGDPVKTRAAYTGDRFTLGDMGYVDDDGYLFLTGRIAECVISGGVNIYPQEIDDLLLSHPAIRDVCTVGIPDDEWGERVVSLVVLVEGVEGNEALGEEIMRYAAARLAGFKRPRRILFERELPRSATGKLLRQKVRERFWVDREKSI
ncbi:MAG: AMP-binding protein [Rhodocyclaceae bacterium]|nr:AMP-binding protein [Rhodocyclaceae bacterium]